MKIATKSIAWSDPNAGAGVSAFHLFYAQGSEAPFSYDNPKIVIPAVEGQAEYLYQLPGGIPLTEGQWTLWIASADAEGNISDPASVTRFFDFTPPLPATNLRVL